MPLPRRAAGWPGGRAGRLVRDLPRRRTLLPARGGDARQGTGAALRPGRPIGPELPGLPRRPVPVPQALRSEGSDAADRSLDGRAGRPEAEAFGIAEARALTSTAEELVPAGPPAHAVSEIAQLPPPTDEESHAAVEKIWRFFCSLRLTLANLLLLFCAMIAGTFVNPQNDSLASIERAFAGQDWTLRAYRWFELYDLFHSWWFTGLLLSLALNLIACSLERLPRIWLLVRHPQRRLDHVVGLRFKVQAANSALTLEDVAGALRRRRYRVEVEDEFLFAERGRHARFGVWVVHLSLLLILGGGVYGRLTAFEGTAQIPQNGGIASWFIQRNPDGTQFQHRLVD